MKSPSLSTIWSWHSSTQALTILTRFRRGQHQQAAPQAEALVWFPAVGLGCGVAAAVLHRALAYATSPLVAVVAAVGFLLWITDLRTLTALYDRYRRQHSVPLAADSESSATCSITGVFALLLYTSLLATCLYSLGPNDRFHAFIMAPAIGSLAAAFSFLAFKPKARGTLINEALPADTTSSRLVALGCAVSVLAPGLILMGWSVILLLAVTFLVRWYVGQGAAKRPNSTMYAYALGECGAALVMAFLA